MSANDCEMMENPNNIHKKINQYETNSRNGTVSFRVRSRFPTLLSETQHYGVPLV